MFWIVCFRKSNNTVIRVNSVIRFSMAMLMACGICWMTLAARASAQESSTRTDKAPWRPSFGDVANTLTGQPATDPSKSPPTPVSNENNQGQQAPPQRQSGSDSPTAPAPAGSTNTANPTAVKQEALPNASTTDRRTTQVGDQIPQGQWQQHIPGNPLPSPDGVPQEITQVSRSFSALPNDGGQVWREYDILPYTSQVTNIDAPQQAIIDWILKQTGTGMWFSQPLGILSATREKIIVYHTPEIHNEIKTLIDRFVYSRGQKHTANINLVTVANPDWRESMCRFLQPIEVSSPQVEAWLISKENAALLASQVSKRSDFQAHASGKIISHNGQKFALEKQTPVQFLRSIRWTPGQAAGFQPLMTQVNEGYRLSISFLDSIDGKSVEALINCDVDQVEKLTSVKVPVGAAGPPNAGFGLGGNNVEKMNLQIPQFVSWRLEERIRWPVDQVLLVSCGVVATPKADAGRGLPGLLDNRTTRADALLFIDFRGPENPRTAQTPVANDNNMRAISPK